MDGALAGCRPGRDVAVSATALAGCGRGRDGRGCGGWRNRDGGVTDAARERHRCVTGVGPGHEDPGKVTLPCVFRRRCDHVSRVDPPIGASTLETRRYLSFRPLRGPEGVTFPASSSTIGPPRASL